MTEATAGTPQPTMADMAEIYYAPSAVFERRRKGGFGIPLLVLVVAVAILYFATAGLMRPILDYEVGRGMAAAAKANPSMTPDQMERAKTMGMKFAPVGIIGFFLVGPLLAGFVLWLVGKVVGVKQELVAAITVGVFSFYPRIIEVIVNAVQAAMLPETSITGKYSVSLGLGRFLDPAASPMMMALVGRVDLFTLWVTFLLALGLKVTGRATTQQAVIAGIMMWIIGALPAVLGAARAAAAG